MSPSLRENAARLASGEPVSDAATPPLGGSGISASAAPLPEVDIPEPGPDGPEPVPVHVAWSRVMADVRKIGKGGEGNEYTGPGAYSFRGIDRTVNAFGPVLRKHGVLVLPVEVEAHYRDVRTSQNKPSKETTVTVSWLVMGPRGDCLPHLLQSAGEALDSSDKGTAKAQSVAQRVLLLTAAQVPTGDPDTDAVKIERGEAPVRTAVDYRDEALDPATSVQRLRQIYYELSQHRMAAAQVVNEHGDDEEIGALVRRVGAERAGGA
ncbi:ERF family protein [Actinomadura rupiterrae]|uniref:ERF family protein n=1 Tax=Actinomadura rupiterrae TaxID=559627 RepID=UPI0020A34FE6|nr:ERF family protein [Actinomadura rupiterrae]MCP2339222.1 hypothetical protein [Actinomadura rupiterrae]